MTSRSKPQNVCGELGLSPGDRVVVFHLGRVKVRDLYVGLEGHLVAAYYDTGPRAMGILRREGEKHYIIHVMWDNGCPQVLLTVYGDRVRLAALPVKNDARKRKAPGRGR